MFKGYLSLGGTEIVNAARVEAYIRKNAPGIPLRNCFDCGSLAEALEDGVYDSPLVDDAPWVDPNNESTNRFYGVYPLEIEGMEDSTRGATVTQAIVDGGSVGAVRLATRSIRVRALLLAADELAMTSGMTWLRNALNPALCSAHGGSCGGAQLCYYAACPVITECWDPTYQAGFSMQVYGETPETSPVLFRETAIQKSIWRATLTPDQDIREGLILRWGAVSDTDDDVWLEQSGPAVMRRINYVPIPNMEGPAGPVFDFWDWDNDGSMVIFSQSDGTHALGFLGGVPGPALNYSWVGVENDSMSEARLVSDNSLAYINRFPNPNYMPAFAGPNTAIRTSYVYSPTPDIAWVYTTAGGVDDIAYDLEIGDDVIPSGRIEWAGVPTAPVASFRTNGTGVDGDTIDPSTIYTISMYGRASAPVNAELRATWYNGAVQVGVSNVTITHDQVDVWKRDSMTVPSPPTATDVTVEYRYTNVDTALPMGGWVEATGLLIEQGTALRQYFDSATANPSVFDDIIYTSNGERSELTMLTIPHVPNVPGLGNAVGAYSIDEQSAVVVPIGTGSNDTYITYGAETGMQLGMVAGGHYAAKATFSQYYEQTGAIHDNARSIVVMVDGVPFARSQQAPNIVDGRSDLQVDFIVPIDATSVSVRYYHGIETGLSYWFDTSIIEVGPSGTYPYRGPAFSGSHDGSLSVNRSGDMAMTSGEVTISFDAQGGRDYGSDLTVRLRSATTDAILAEALFALPGAPIWEGPGSPPQEFTRYSFTSSVTEGLAYLEFERGGEANVTRVMIERGFTPLPYFDGSTPIDEAMAGYRDPDIAPEVEYNIFWQGEVNRSPSQVDYAIEALTFGGSSDPEVWASTLNGICHGIPRVDIAQGLLKGGFGVGLRLPISPERQVRHLERTMHEVTAVEGPTIISERVLGSGAVMREVDFLLIAGKPSPYGPTLTLLLDQQMSELDTTEWIDQPCVISEPEPIIDPDCPPIPAPPRPPAIPNSCVVEQTVWQRYWLPIDKEYVSSWSETAPQVTIISGTQEIRQIRVQVFANPFDREVQIGPDGEALSRRNWAIDGRVTTGTIGSGWNVVGSGTSGRLTGAFIPGTDLDAYYRSTSTVPQAESLLGVVYGNLAGTPVTPGVPFRPGMFVRSSFGGRNILLRLTYRDAAGVQIGSPVMTPFGIPNPNEWYWIYTSTDRVPPAGAAWVQIAAVGGGIATAPTGTTTDVTGVVLITGNERDASHYFDGNANGNGFYNSWLGTPEQSVTYSQSSPVDPCSACSEFIVSYLPAQTTLTVDSILERAFATVAGGETASANHLLYSGDGSPMTWPELTCGNPYLMAIDVPEPLLDDVRVRVTVTNKE